MQRLPTRGGSRPPLVPIDSGSYPSRSTSQTPEVPTNELVSMRPSSSSYLNSYNRTVTSTQPKTNFLKQLAGEEKPKRDYVKYPFLLQDGEEDQYYYSSNAKSFWSESRANVKEAPYEKLKDISTGITDFEPGDEALRDEMHNVINQTKAVTLWALSSGLSNVDTSGSVFSREDNVVNVDVKAILSRPNSASSSKSARMSRASPVPGPFDELIDVIENSGTKFKSVSEMKDPTTRTYILNPSGRSTNTIYHRNTKRPTRLSDLVEHINITNESLYTYISTENVRVLDLERCVDLDNKVLKSIGEFCPRLKTLNLQHCSQVRDSTIRIIANGCCDIQSLNIGMCHLLTDDSLIEIFTHCTKLNVLSAHSCDLITGDTSFPLTKNAPELQVLDISYCPKISDLAIQFLSEYCLKLRHFDISGCSLIQDEGLISMCKHCPQIRTLRATILSQPTITNDTLKFLTNYARNLEVLELSGVIQITDATVAEICKYGSKLEFISLSGCPAISDDSIQSISDYCRNLKCLEIASCRKVGVQALLELIHKVPKLKRIVVTRCNISEEELEILRKFTNGRTTVIKHLPIPKEPTPEYFCVVKEPTKKKGVTRKKKKKA